MAEFAPVVVGVAAGPLVWTDVSEAPIPVTPRQVCTTPPQYVDVVALPFEKVTVIPVASEATGAVQIQT
jgi:hypothetical protein